MLEAKKGTRLSCCQRFKKAAASARAKLREMAESIAVGVACFLSSMIYRIKWS